MNDSTNVILLIKRRKGLRGEIYSNSSVLFLSFYSYPIIFHVSMGL